MLQVSHYLCSSHMIVDEQCIYVHVGIFSAAWSIRICMYVCCVGGRGHVGQNAADIRSLCEPC